MKSYPSLCLSISIVALAAASALADPLYRVTDLGRAPGYTFSTMPLSINNRGQVVGFVQQTLTRAFVWSEATGMQLLPLVPGNEDRSSQAVDINEHGDIVGFSGQSGGSNLVAWVYRSGQYTFLGALPGLDNTVPAAINDVGEVVGNATGGFNTRGFYWSDATGIVDLVPDDVIELYDINNDGIATGGRRTDPPSGIMTWSVHTSASADLGMLPDTSLSFGYSINDSGLVAGSSIYISSAGHRTAHAVFVGPDTEITDTGLFQAVASGVNERGQVVGWRTFQSNSTFYSWLYTPGQGLIDDLHAVIDQANLYTRVSNARGINDFGQIVASSALSQGADPFRRGVVLTPIAPLIRGDLNCDGVVDFSDIDAFVDALSGARGYQSTHPNCSYMMGDMDCDGAVTFADIDPFVARLGGATAGCP